MSTTGVVRAIVDPSGKAGEILSPATNGACATAQLPYGACNAPNKSNNGVPFDAASALCGAFGYKTGSIVRDSNANPCPQAHAISPNGDKWNSDFINDAGAGMEWKCATFK
ncbi:MAG: hypothetical protein EXR75_10745 [Myxococcales bacterium]|nr:hypothetical protein [Myxococcales bacterium]